MSQENGYEEIGLRCCCPVSSAVFVLACSHAGQRRRLPGSISITGNGDGYIRYKVIKSLEKMRDSSFVPVLHEAIQDKEKYDDEEASSLIRALIACGGLTIEEMVAALESCAAEVEVSVDNHRANRRLRIHPQTKSFDVLVGQIVAEQEYASEALAAAVLERLKALRKEKPDVAAKLWLIAQQWRFPSVKLELVEQIADGVANLDALLEAFDRRQDLRDHDTVALRELAVAGGYKSGIGVALLGDQAGALDILNGGDRAAKLALLACARMLREPLPVEKIGAFLKSPDKLLALAAERYLESEDSPTARKLILALHPTEALILGARGAFDQKPENQEHWIRWEDRLREDLKKGQADEIFAALEFYYSDVAPFRSSHSAIVRVRQGKAELCKQKDPRAKNAANSRMANCKRWATFTKKSRSTIWGRSAYQVMVRAVACRSLSSWRRAVAGASILPNCTT